MFSDICLILKIEYYVCSTCSIDKLVDVLCFFFFECNGDHRDLHRLDRRQRQMCIRDSYKAVYPHPSVYKCNEYFVQICPGKLDTVAGVFCGDWLLLWSKISRSGDYWSFEWKICGSKGSSFCSPDVRDFGHKGKGWHQTWFKGTDLGLSLIHI